MTEDNNNWICKYHTTQATATTNKTSSPSSHETPQSLSAHNKPFFTPLTAFSLTNTFSTSNSSPSLPPSSPSSPKSKHKSIPGANIYIIYPCLKVMQQRHLRMYSRHSRNEYIFHCEKCKL